MNTETEEGGLFQSLLKEFLKVTYLLTVEKGSFTTEEFSSKLERTTEEGKALLSVLASMNLIKRLSKPPNTFLITQGGKNNLKIVLTGGVFDIIHLGHINTLKAAKEGGDILIIVVASDKMVESTKGRSPLNSQANRMKLLNELSIVDITAKGSPDPSNFLETVVEYEPNVIALGYDQTSTEKMLLEQLEKFEMENIEIKKLDIQVPNEKSSLKFKNLDQHSFE
jgi:glycerol-3-phosphate cytidylyltransferase/FAD synthetase